ncbi:MAG TPA: nucleoside triphosphate pyrophosphohydrolase [Gemmatimonadales bacterium]|nr:nucleoside triphosphate pyrophosphohydrolase [Gemmatimonadales bacterium]
MQDTSALARIVDLVRDLRRRCPWDGAQTPQTLRPYLVEEALELDHALGSGSDPAIRDELGDLMLHIAFQIVLGEERGAYGTEDVVAALERKMWRRHPRLFPAQAAGEAAQSEDSHANWERNKIAERPPGGPGVLDGLPPNLPALIMALRLQERAAGVGFDWPDSEGPLEKIREELNELRDAVGQGTARTGEEGRGAREQAKIEHEIGDLLFSVVNLARKLGCDPRAALERANARFRERFRQVERLAAERGVQIGHATLEELDRLWEEAKKGSRP